jgi:hypothetical protein
MTWQFESSYYPGYCMSTAWTSSSQNWQLVPCSAGDGAQWWASSKQPDGATVLDSWNDFDYCLVNHEGGIAPERCSGNPNNLPNVYFWWTLK